MVLSAALRKSLGDLTRRRSRACFTVATLALAVASIGILALPTLVSRAMSREIAASRLADVTITVRPLALSDAQLQALRGLPNVTAFEPRATFSTRVYLGARREKAFVIGERSFTHQSVDAVTVTAGVAPGPGAVLTDAQNAGYGRGVGGTGGAVRLVAASGAVLRLPISGVGRSLTGAQLVAQNGFVTLYATASTMAALSGARGYTRLAFRLRDDAPRAAAATVAAIRRYLGTVPGFTGFSDLPQVRAPGEWPGKSRFDHFVSVLYVITLLALVCALVLVANTVSTLIGEQTPEIATMKALGAGRREVRRVYLRTVALLAALGAAGGAALGMLVAYALEAYFGSSLWAIATPFSVDVAVVAASVAVGLVGPLLVALPAIRRAAGLPLAEALQASGSAMGRSSPLEGVLRRAWFLPRSAQIGLRGVARRKRRSAATVLEVAVAVATLLALLSLAAGVSDTVQASWRSYRFDIWAGSQLDQPLPPGAARLIASTPGVRSAEPVLVDNVKLGGCAGTAWGLPARPPYRFHLVAGRLLTAADARARAHAVVVEQSIARASATHVGERVQLATAAGPAWFTVVGLVSDQQDDGTVLFLPLATLQSVLRLPGAVDGYWIVTASSAHHAIDATNTRLEDELAAHGMQTTTTVAYVGEQEDVAAYRGITTAVTALGILIVAISMVGLINAITLAVLERTREIGTLRCIGAHARDVRSIFATEGLAVALAGWLLGVPLGLGFAHGIGALAAHAVNERLLFTFPPVDIAIALVGTVALALLVMLVPLHRAVAFRPGEALRYA